MSAYILQRWMVWQNVAAKGDTYRGQIHPARGDCKVERGCWGRWGGWLGYVKRYVEVEGARGGGLRRPRAGQVAAHRRVERGSSV